MSNIRTMLVIGENHKEIAKKYSLDTKVEPYLIFDNNDENKKKLKDSKLRALKSIIDNPDIISKIENQFFDINQIKQLYSQIEKMTDDECYESYIENLKEDEYELIFKNDKVYTNRNKIANYKYEKCPQDNFLKTHNESSFSNPFKLLNGDISYSCKVSDVDWSKMHLYNKELYYRTWEIIKEGDKPRNEQEENIYYYMKNRKAYFDNFTSKENYMLYNTSFWTYGVAREDGYDSVDSCSDSMNWVMNFYNDWISHLDKDEIITMYEIKLLKA